MSTNRESRCIVLCGLLLFSISAGLYLWLLHDLPSPEDLQAFTTAPSSKIYDRHGRLLFEMPPPYTGSHTPVPLEQIPEALRWATIALEDRTFYENPGFDLRGVLRAILYNLRSDDYLMGGSTITQQMVRNLMLSPDERHEQTLRRKLREAWLAVRITRRYTKDEILTFYLNEIYYGNMAYGVEAAAQAYYAKHVWDLDLAESAMLAILPHAPAYWNPLENLEEAKRRQAIALDRMVTEGYITAEDAQLAKEEQLTFAAAPFLIRAPHFVMYVRGILERELGLERLQAGGLEIHTTVDVDLNEAARDLMRHQLELLAHCNHETPCPPGGYNVRNAAIVALDPHSGEILAMVGSPDYFSARINGAVNGTTALRQPGSAIKPITYAAAFEQGLTPATVMMDVRTSFETREGTPYVPLNYDLAFRGPVRLREALASSYNVIAVKVLERVGIDAMTDLARRLNITTFDDPGRLGLSLTLGGGEVRLVELTAAYAAFANGGHSFTPEVIRSVGDAEGTTIWRSSCNGSENCFGEPVLDPRIGFLITDILSDDGARIPTFGEESVLKLIRPAAAKTGTTTDYRDNWTVGYTPDLVVGVWVGNADNEVMKNVSGVTGAAPLWHDVMETAHRGLTQHEFVRPEGITEVEVCAVSGKQPTVECPHRIVEIFVAGTEPTESCDMHQRVGEQVYLILPPEAQAWGRDHGIPQPPSTVTPEGEAPTLLITSPDDGAIFHINATLPRSRQKIRVNADTGIDLAQLTLFVDGRPLADFDGPPYATLWQLEPGEHTFQARGVGKDNSEITSEIVTIIVRP